jgi:multicomponent Na+:H+ antiporter subunit A
VRVFLQGRSTAPKKGADPGWKMLAPVWILSLSGIALGLFYEIHLKASSILGIALGVAVYFGIKRWIALRDRPSLASEVYDRATAGLSWLAAAQTRILQNGYLRTYVAITLVVMFGVSAGAIWFFGGVPRMGAWRHVRLYELVVCAFVIAGAVGAAWSRSRFRSVASLGAMGYGVALLYIFFGAPDLALTQFLVETLIVVLFVLVFRRLPRIESMSDVSTRLRNITVAGAAGVLMAALALTAGETRSSDSVSSYFLDQSVPAGHGRNIVNVILTDFRALDTLGEITVLAVASVGVFALLKARSKSYEHDHS